MKNNLIVKFLIERIWSNNGKSKPVRLNRGNCNGQPDMMGVLWI
jgi:hypothetical protein